MTATMTDATMTDSVLAVEDLSVTFPTDDGDVHAVRGVSYRLRPREVLGIVGESGSGKSVSSMAVLGLLPAGAKVTGSIRYRDRELVGLSYKDMRSVRNNGVAMIFQDPMTSLNPVYTIGWQLAEAYRAHHAVSKKAAWAKAVEALDLVGIPRPDRSAKQYPHEFSGGMRQRVVIAMAIINDPDVIIADEPTTALDVTVQAQILETLLRIRDETATAIVMITHDLGVVAGMVDRVQVMYGGTVVESGPVDELFDYPRMPYTVGLLGSLPNPAALGKRLTPIKGAPPSLINLPTGCAFSPRCPLAEDECRTAEPLLLPTERADHATRCHRWQHLSTLSRPQSLFEHEEIGVMENPAALTTADPDMPVIEESPSGDSVVVDSNAVDSIAAEEKGGRA
ncbi:ABC transporter ATP-binding protein [Actinokineospora iranica]|uniref:Peptide/nickel transport system ATP-binding protein n=1 Tax=Actinokineospora iranica TaxID=1271860 RepID=A0A1G6R7S3_9PSEU|nr:ABC transporter ATP-binding protein [Actinokineospora iranica]SDD00682.1 peptide/nickel transport system ATP-binding protein [Actinokineospora iranica]